MKTFAFAAIVVASACNTDKPAPLASTTNTTETASSGAEPSAVPGGHHGRRACPSRVRGATATASDVDGGVMISVTGGDDVTIAEIQSRANALGAMPPDARRGRFCPEMEEGTTRTIVSTSKGAQITIVPTNASDLAHVRSDVRDHLEHAEKRPD